MPEIARILIRKQIVLIISTLTTFLTGITTIILSGTGNFRGEGGPEGATSIDKGTLKNG